MVVSDDDPDSTVSDMVDHVATRHARDALLGDPNVIVLETDDSGSDRG
jgi:hypothetical protein